MVTEGFTLVWDDLFGALLPRLFAIFAIQTSLCFYAHVCLFSNSYACCFWVSLPPAMVIKQKGGRVNSHTNRKHRLVILDKGADVKTEIFNTMTASLLYLAKGKCN